MRQFVAFVKKEFYHILRDKRTILVLLVMPIVEIIIFGFAISLEVKNVRVGVLALNEDNLVEQIVTKLNSDKHFQVTHYISNEQEMMELFQEGIVDVVLMFDRDFNSSIYTQDGARVHLVIDSSEGNMAQSYNTYTIGVLLQVYKEMTDFAIDRYGITPNMKFMYNPQMISSYMFVPGIMGFILIIICAMMTSISIVREKERGTMEVLLVSPIKPIYIIVSKMVPYFVLSCVNLATILLLSFFLLDVPISGSLGTLIGVSLLYIIVSLSLGLLISSITRQQTTAIILSAMILLIPSLLLSGMLFPIEGMPKILQWVSNIVPPRWYISAVKKLMIMGLPIKYVFKEIVIMTGMAFVLIAFSWKKFKFRLE